MGKILGEGANAVVRPAIHLHNGKIFAIKTYNKIKLCNPSKRENVESEILHLTTLSHPNVIQFIDRFENRRNIHVVIEYAGKNNLKKVLDDEKQKYELRRSKSQIGVCLGQSLWPGVGVSRALKYVRQVIEAVQHIHSRGVVHRDLKLENVVINEDSHELKLVDFGFAREDRMEVMRSEICGTPNYMAPELHLREKHLSKPTDIWAIGVIIYYLLTGSFPFFGKTEVELNQSVIKAEPDYEGIRRLRDGEMFVKLLRGIFVLDAAKRWKIDKICDFFNRNCSRL